MPILLDLELAADRCTVDCRVAGRYHLANDCSVRERPPRVLAALPSVRNPSSTSATMTTPLAGCDVVIASSSVSAGGQVEQPSAAKSSTITGTG